MKRQYKTSFEATHVIVGHEKCGTLHGHSYHLVVYVDFDPDKWLDFADLKARVDRVLKRYDHQVLGCIKYKPTIDATVQPAVLHIELDVVTMTCEILARKLKAEISTELFYVLGNDFVLTIELWETDKCGVITDV